MNTRDTAWFDYYRAIGYSADYMQDKWHQRRLASLMLDVLLDTPPLSLEPSTVKFNLLLDTDDA